MINKGLKFNNKDNNDHSPTTLEKSSPRINSDSDNIERNISFFPTNPNCKSK